MKTLKDAALKYVQKYNINDSEDGLEKTLCIRAFLAGNKFNKTQLLDIIEEMRIELENSACELANVYNNIHNIDHCKEQSISNRETIIKIKQKLEGLND